MSSVYENEDILNERSLEQMFFKECKERLGRGWLRGKVLDRKDFGRRTQVQSIRCVFY